MNTLRTIYSKALLLFAMVILATSCMVVKTVNPVPNSEDSSIKELPSFMLGTFIFTSEIDDNEEVGVPGMVIEEIAQGKYLATSFLEASRDDLEGIPGYTLSGDTLIIREDSLLQELERLREWDGLGEAETESLQELEMQWEEGELVSRFLVEWHGDRFRYEVTKELLLDLAAGELSTFEEDGEETQKMVLLGNDGYYFLNTLDQGPESDGYWECLFIQTTPLGFKVLMMDYSTIKENWELFESIALTIKNEDRTIILDVAPEKWEEVLKQEGLLNVVMDFHRTSDPISGLQSINPIWLMIGLIVTIGLVIFFMQRRK